MVCRDTSEKGQWDTLATMTNFSAEKYLDKHHVSYEFSSSDLDRFGFFFRNGNLFLGNNSKNIVISDLENNLHYLKILLDTTRWYNTQMLRNHHFFLDKKAKIVEYFRGNDFYFFVIRTGSSAIDINYYQFVVPINASRIRTAVEYLERK